MPSAGSPARSPGSGRRGRTPPAGWPRCPAAGSIRTGGRRRRRSGGTPPARSAPPQLHLGDLGDLDALHPHVRAVVLVETHAVGELDRVEHGGPAVVAPQGVGVVPRPPLRPCGDQPVRAEGHAIVLCGRDLRRAAVGNLGVGEDVPPLPHREPRLGPVQPGLRRLAPSRRPAALGQMGPVQRDEAPRRAARQGTEVLRVRGVGQVGAHPATLPVHAGVAPASSS